MGKKKEYKKARRRVREQRGFYFHLIIYVLVGAFLVGVNVKTSPDDLWVVYPLIGWGIGIAFHAVSAFSDGIWGKAWEERKIKEILERDKSTGTTQNES